MAKVKIIRDLRGLGDTQVEVPDDMEYGMVLTVHNLTWDDSVYVEIAYNKDLSDFQNIIIKRKHWDKLVAALSKGEEK